MLFNTFFQDDYKWRTKKDDQFFGKSEGGKWRTGKMQDRSRGMIVV